MREQTENETLLEYCMKCLPDFTFENGLLKKENEKGIMELSNFLPIPLEEVQYDNGEDVQRSFKIMALKLHNGEVNDLPAATVKSDDLAGMGWGVDNWGFRANIYPPQNSRKDYLRYVLFELGHHRTMRTSALVGSFPPTLRCENLKSTKDFCVSAPRFDGKYLAHRSRPIMR